MREAALTPSERAETTQEVLRGEGWELRKEGAAVRDRLPGVQGGGDGAREGGDEWLSSSHAMGVLSVGSSGSCEACFSEGGDKEGVGRGGDDWVSSSSCEMGSLSAGPFRGGYGSGLLGRGHGQGRVSLWTWQNWGGGVDMASRQDTWGAPTLAPALNHRRRGRDDRRRAGHAK